MRDRERIKRQALTQGILLGVMIIRKTCVFFSLRTELGASGTRILGGPKPFFFFFF